LLWTLTKLFPSQRRGTFRLAFDSGDYRPETGTRGKKFAAAHHHLCVQILNAAALLSTQDSKTSNVDDRRDLTMFSHVARELGAHPCIGSRASDLADELREVGVARVIAATAVDGEVPISTETICRPIETEGA
jgi:hypothetical protein